MEKDYLMDLPAIISLRDGFAFAAHIESAAKEAGREVVPEFYKFPVFYYSNHLSIIGGGPVYVQQNHLDKLDFELEVAIVIGKQGKNIKAKNADEYIAGFTIMNDFSARTIQWEEMRLKLGPAKGKDFATALGPKLVPLAHLESKRILTTNGSHWDLPMFAYLNGKKISAGNLKDMYFTFAEIIERCSYGTTLYPGEAIGSGTVGSGCLRELNYHWREQAKSKNEDFDDVWLKPGDTIELEVEGLGRLKNEIILQKE